MRRIFFLICLFFSLNAFTQDSTFIKVHFLYGSKPLKQYKDTERKWFGGMLGGHVGVEANSDRILDFSPKGKFHVFTKKDDPHSAFSEHSPEQFYSILAHKHDTVKKAIVYIPVSREQKQKFDSLSAAYLQKTPYDYALFGMRCSAAAYDILSQLDIVPGYSYSKTYKKIFYPKKLRKRLFKKADENGWTIMREDGSPKRKWEKD